MDKKLITATMLSFALLSACSNNNNGKNVAENPAVYKKDGNTVNKYERVDMNNKGLEKTSADKQNEFGYVRQVKSPVPGQNIKYQDIYTLNREKVADSISKIAVTNPKVHDAATLVTDEEVLIWYKTDAKSKADRNNVADQVKKTAFSIVPRWYHVYVTDNPTLRQYVENISYMKSSDANKERVIRQTVKMMLDSSPQGHKMSTGENENGESKDINNGKMEDTDDLQEQHDNGNL
ncbi:MAG: YhcN/YlaJ family sporulation lipoprotein [Heyndrickxia sp.]